MLVVCDVDVVCEVLVVDCMVLVDEPLVDVVDEVCDVLVVLDCVLVVDEPLVDVVDPPVVTVVPITLVDVVDDTVVVVGLATELIIPTIALAASARVAGLNGLNVPSRYPLMIPRSFAFSIYGQLQSEDGISEKSERYDAAWPNLPARIITAAISCRDTLLRGLNVPSAYPVIMPSSFARWMYPLAQYELATSEKLEDALDGCSPIARTMILASSARVILLFGLNVLSE